MANLSLNLYLFHLISLSTRRIAIPLLLIYSTPTFLSFLPDIVEYYTKLVIGGLVLMITLFISGFISVVLSHLGLSGLSLYFSGILFETLVRTVTGIAVVKSGRVEQLRRGKGEGRVFVANHLTEFDIYILSCGFPKYCTITVKAELKTVPLLGWNLVLHDALFIDRKNPAKTLRSFRAAGEQIRQQGTSAYLFCEGQRSYMQEPGMLPFKKGAFHLAIQAQVPIVPVVIQNYSNLLDKDRTIFKRGRVVLKVLDPIPTSGMTEHDVDDLVMLTRERMLTAAKELGQASQT